MNKANPNSGPRVGSIGRARSACIQASAAARASVSALTSTIGIDHAGGSAMICRGIAGRFDDLDPQRIDFDCNVSQCLLEHERVDESVDLDVLADIVGRTRWIEPLREPNPQLGAR